MYAYITNVYYVCAVPSCVRCRSKWAPKYPNRAEKQKVVSLESLQLNVEKIMIKDLKRLYLRDLLKTDGDFLLRRKFDDEDLPDDVIILSVFTGKKMCHIPFPENKKEFQDPGDPKFNSLQDFLSFYYQTGKPMSVERVSLVRPILADRVDWHKIKLDHHLKGGNCGQIRRAVLKMRSEPEEVVAMKLILGNENERQECLAVAEILSQLMGMAGFFRKEPETSSSSTTVDQKMVEFRPVYSEEPYVAILDGEYMLNRCSNCFLIGMMPCSGGCAKAVYCDPACAKSDHPLHQYECQSYKEGSAARPPPILSIDLQTWNQLLVIIRLVGRMAARLLLDKGVAKVADGLPKGVKSFTFDDLKQAPNGMKKKLKPLMFSFHEGFRGFFGNTKFGKVTTKKQLNRLVYVLARNTVHVRHTIPSSTMGAVSTGRAIYLNKHRFGHNCHPDLVMQMEPGPYWRMGISQIVEEGGKVSKIGAATFDRLTLDQTRSLACGHNGYLTLNADRKNLGKNMDIRCPCVKCGDEEAADVEENAAVYECEKCRRPYVWMLGSSQMRPSCRCEKTRKCLEGDQDTIRLHLELLNLQYTETMVRLEHCLDPDRVILQCESVLALGERYWHPVKNLRLAQVYSKLFVAYQAKVRPERCLQPDHRKGMNQPFEVIWAEKGVRMGEAMLDNFEYHQSLQWHHIIFARIYLQLALLSSVIRDKDRFVMWLSKSKATFELNGMKEIGGYLQDWMERDMKKSW